MSGIYHSWNGTTLTITSDSGTSSANLQGEMGVRGPQGPAGGAINDVSLIDKTLTIENYAADAKAVGDKLAQVDDKFSEVDDKFSEVDDKFSEVDEACIINTATGSLVVLNDSSNNKLKGLSVLGKTTQNGTPTPDTPVELVSVGAGGSITVSVADGDGNTQTLTVSTPNGLPGVPVKTGGNYIDENGKQWICDEIDFVRGVYVKRTNQITVDGSDDETWNDGATTSAPFGVICPNIAKCTGTDTQLLCDRYPTATYNEAWAPYNFMVSRNAVNGPWVVFRNINITTLDAWKTYISANPITIQYVLKEPIETPLTAEQLEAYAAAALHTYKPTTTITSATGLKVDYVADTKLYIDNRLNAITQAIISLGGNI